MAAPIAFSEKKDRNPNFTPADCILLCEVMGGRSSVDKKLTNYAVYKAKSVPWITSTVKKELWQHIKDDFNAQSHYPRSSADLSKKWDNLAQTHRAKYSDYIRDATKTGAAGGRKNPLNPVTEAVMDVVGRQTVNIHGILPAATGFDTTWMQCTSVGSSPSSRSVLTSQPTSAFHINPLPQITDVSEDAVTPHSSEAQTFPEFQPVLNVDTIFSSNDISCSNQCSHCKLCLEVINLKKRKLELEVALLEKKLKTN